uniref:Insulin like growth factor binding protein 7 n=1 Tax=Anolis carolinensis TaxID=28377 RepID=A0A803TIU2_ANOCA
MSAPSVLLLGACCFFCCFLSSFCSGSLASPGETEPPCPPCVPSACPALPPGGCPLGKVREGGCRSCCWRCARGEGEACGFGGAGTRTGRCRPGLEVKIYISVEGPGWEKELLSNIHCFLKALNLCRCLLEFALRPFGEIGPSIVTPPKDIWNITGAQIFLSCEVIGVPTPVLTWNKISRGQYGVQRMELLPGDRDNLAIQTRGGPEKHEVTGWVLISPLSEDDAGEYECHASNSKGEATASAKITIVNSINEIPTKKGASLP